MSTLPAASGSPSPHPATTPDFRPRPENWSSKNSVFWRRIDEAGHRSLEVALGGLLDDASALSQRVAGALPRFTLHDSTHLNNVLWWMEGLVTEKGLAALGPKGCGLCLLLAYVHDLGMVPETGWKEKLKDENSPESVRLRRFTNERHADLADMLERNLPTEPVARAKAERVRAHIRDFIRTDFLRVTHAEDGDDSRVIAHLRSLLAGNEMKQALGWLCAEETALQLVALLIASHNKSVGWLEQRLRQDFGLERPWTWMAAGAERVNVLLPCLLLRLADICDFDASRTPRIVFNQLGLEGAESLGLAKLDDAVGISRGEWKKHLAVDGWSWSGGDGGELVYSASACPHPAVEKAIRGFCSDIEREFVAVERALRSMAGDGAREWLRIPREVRPSVTPCGYVFHDIEFKLQAHEVTELLMGTALYGNPELCIRELLQNALDAVQLRELRIKLKTKLSKSKEHRLRLNEVPEAKLCDDWLDDEEAAPKIELTWGRDAVTGREWIQVKDRGTGMTLDQITRYLSALGKSYYKSAEFGAEARLMREHGLIATPISQFGIGILSCFMIAEWMEVRTCPCGRDNDKRKAWQVKITGPGALFHFTDLKDTETAGTEVRLYLKRGFVLVDIPREILLKRLERDFNYRASSGSHADNSALPVYEREEDGVRYINPASIAAKHVIWPRHSIVCRPTEETAPLLMLHGRWHFEQFVPWPKTAVQTAATKDGCPVAFLAGAGWRVWDWNDDVGPEATGSRIRLVFPSVSSGNESDLAAMLQTRLSQARVVELAMWASGSIIQGPNFRRRYLVRGMHVENTKEAAAVFGEIAAGIGAWVWVDFAGAAGPALTADRSRVRAMSGNLAQEWASVVAGVYSRWVSELAWRTSYGSAERATLRCLVMLTPRLRGALPTTGKAGVWSLHERVGLPWQASTAAAADFAQRVLHAEEACSRVSLGPRVPSLSRDPHHFVRGRNVQDRDLALAYRRVNDLDSSLASSFTSDQGRPNERSIVRSRARINVRNHLGRVWYDAVGLSYLNEGFMPSIEQSLPYMNLPASGAELGSAHLLAPTVVGWSDTNGSNAESPVNLLGYDLVFPLSVIALPSLLRSVPGWHLDRNWRGLLVLPFVWPENRLVRDISQAMRSPISRGVVGSGADDESARRLIAVQTEARQIATQSIHVLFPRSDWWARPFAEWSEEDWAVCGYSAQWNISTGELLWTVGGVARGDMQSRGAPSDAFFESDHLAQFRKLHPQLFYP